MVAEPPTGPFRVAQPATAITKVAKFETYFLLIIVNGAYL
jgi:hypothetical protein